MQRLKLQAMMSKRILLELNNPVFIFDSGWSPKIDLQTQDSTHRNGKKNEVRVYRIISSGTGEENILERNQKSVILLCYLQISSL